MSPSAATSTPVLTEVELDELRFLVGRMVPADLGYSVPGADDPLIVADMVGSLGRERDAVRRVLGLVHRLRESAESGASISKDIATFIMHLASLDPSGVAALEAVVVRCYYRDDRVLRAIGMEPRPPFPTGYELETADWSLLDLVKSRGPIWRQAERD